MVGDLTYHSKYASMLGTSRPYFPDNNSPHPQTRSVARRTTAINLPFLHPHIKGYKLGGSPLSSVRSKLPLSSILPSLDRRLRRLFSSWMEVGGQTGGGKATGRFNRILMFNAWKVVILERVWFSFSLDWSERDKDGMGIIDKCEHFQASR